MEVKDLKFDKRNYRRHSEKNQSLIKKSINEVGFGRSIVVDAENEIICGNGVVSQVDKKTPVKVIETDGNELIVVKRTDLKTDDAKRKQLAVMDNSTSDSSDFDLDLLQEDFDADLLGDWGIIIKTLSDAYTRKISTPIYEIKGECPELNEMIDTSKADKFIDEINKMKIEEPLKEFLRKTATRLYEFRYDKIAEYYAHQDKEIQGIMEKLALVIIDINKAIENGYIELNNFIENCFMEDANIEKGIEL